METKNNYSLSENDIYKKINPCNVPYTLSLYFSQKFNTLYYFESITDKRYIRNVQNQKGKKYIGKKPNIDCIKSYIRDWFLHQCIEYAKNRNYKMRYVTIMRKVDEEIRIRQEIFNDMYELGEDVELNLNIPFILNPYIFKYRKRT